MAIFGGSLLAILGIAGLVHLLALGTGGRIHNKDHARALANETQAGFAPETVLLDDDGRAALLEDGSGNALVLRRHGQHFVGRVIDAGNVQRNGDTVVVQTGERRFGTVTMRCSGADEAASDA